jgi:dipeptidase E
MRRLLLISNSTSYGGGYLDHCETEIRDFLSGIQRLAFVPFAAHDLDRYATKVRERFEKMGMVVDSIHEADYPMQMVEDAEAVFIGGGNTFRLLTRLYETDLLELIFERVKTGMRYMGASAGSNVACPTIMTTNDMPIMQPESFLCLGLVPFQINPHFLDADAGTRHMGETREERIREYHEVNDLTVVGLREGTLLRIEGTSVTLKGASPARIFVKGEDPREYPPGSSLDFLLTRRRQ